MSMESAPGVRVELTNPEERSKNKVRISSDMFTEGKLYASQNWAKGDEAKRAKAFISGRLDTYGEEEPVVAYSFRDKDGRECFLMGDGHHRVAESIIEGKPIEAEIDAKLGLLDSNVLKDPNRAAQALAILGVQGIWPFKTFMAKFIDVRIDSNGVK